MNGEWENTESLKNVASDYLVSQALEAEKMFNQQKEKQGGVSDFYNWCKEVTGSEEAATKIYAKLQEEKMSALLIQRAQEGKLTELDYYSSKADLYEKIAEKTGSSEYKSQAENYRRLANNVLAENTKLRKTEEHGLQKEQNFRLMTFEETFEKERGVKYDAESIEDYDKKSAYSQMIVGMYNQKAVIESKLEQALAYSNAAKGGGEYTMDSTRVEKLKMDVYRIFVELFGKENVQRKLEEMGLNGTLDPFSPENKDDNGRFARQAAEALKTYLNNQFTKNCNGKSFEQIQQETTEAYKKAYGDRNSDDIAQAFIQSQKMGVETVKGAVAGTGMVIMLAGQFVPAGNLATGMVLGGLGTATVGGAAVGAAEAITQKGGMTKEDAENILKELSLSVALTATGMKIGKMTSSLYGALVLRNCPMLMAKVSEIGADATLSLISTYALTGELDISGESISQLIPLLTGILKTKGNLKQYLVDDFKMTKQGQTQKPDDGVNDGVNDGVTKGANTYKNRGQVSQENTVKILTAEDGVNYLMQKLQTETDYFEIREIIDNLREISQNDKSISLNENFGCLQVRYKREQYTIEHDSHGKILGYQKRSHEAHKMSYFKYDENGKLTETDQLGFNDVKANNQVGNVNCSDYILKNKNIPVDIAKKMLSYEYHFTKDTIDEILSLIKNESDWKIVDKILSTKGDTRFFVRTTANTAVNIFDRIYEHNSNDKYKKLSDLIDSEFLGCPFTSYDIVKILKSEKAQQYVIDCIENNKYCDRDKIIKYVQLESVEKKKLSDENDLSYEMQDIKLDKIENVAEKYKSDSQIRRFIDSKIPNGEVGNINGKLYCRANGELIPVNLSKTMFGKLFPISERYNIKQGNVGDCWLISDIAGMMSTPNGRANIYTYFREENGNIYVKLPDTNIEVCFNYDKWKSLKTDGVKEHNGTKMLEQAAAFVKSISSADTPTTVYANDKSKINKVLKTLDGGQVGGGLSFVCRREQQKNLMFYDVHENNFNKNEVEATKDLDIILSEVDAYLKKNPNAICPIEFRKSITIDNITFDGDHVCRIVGYDKETQILQIVNPHDGNTTVSISLKSFLNCAGMINLYSISTNAIHNVDEQFSAKRLNKGLGIYL